MSSSYTYITNEEVQAQTTSQFTQKAKDYFAPKPRSREATKAFARIVKQVHARPTTRIAIERELDRTPFLYLNGKSRRWHQYGKELESAGCLEDVYSLTSEYLEFLSRINQQKHKQAISRLRKLDRCWEGIDAWKSCQH